jgi:hypothetical protein
MDIREGDFLVVGSDEYPIKSCADWTKSGMNSTSFRRMATVTAGTKRTKKGEPATVLSNLKCTPLDPVDPELRRRLALETPHELLQTFIADSAGFVHLILEDLK